MQVGRAPTGQTTCLQTSLSSEQTLLSSHSAMSSTLTETSPPPLSASARSPSEVTFWVEVTSRIDVFVPEVGLGVVEAIACFLLVLLRKE